MTTTPAGASPVDLSLGLETERAQAKRTADVYILLLRFGGDHWGTSGCFRSLAEAQIAANTEHKHPWRIVVARDLPIEVADNEA